MKLTVGSWTIELRRRQVRHPERVSDLTDLELTAAFAVPESHKLYRAVLQILREEEAKEHRNAAQNVDQPNRAFVFMGGALKCEGLRQEFEDRRELGLPALRFVKPRGLGQFERLDMDAAGRGSSNGN